MTSKTVPSLRTQENHALIGKADQIPISPAVPVISVSPVQIAAPDRLLDLQMRVSAPVIGTDLPIIILSHGQGWSNNLSSSNGYGPLANFWAAHGFVVMQPTHLSSRSLSIDPSTPGGPMFWRSRAQDVTQILDALDEIESQMPAIRGRLDRDRIAIAGHSMGGHTAGMILGMQVTDPEDGDIVDMSEPRIKAGVILAGPGNGGADLNTTAFEKFSFMRQPNFTTMKTPTLIVNGDQDIPTHLSKRGADWFRDPYTLSPSPKALLTLKGGEHGLGGVAGYDAAESRDESPERVALVQRLTAAYLRSILYPEDHAWSDARAAFQNVPELGSIESK